MNGSRGGKPLVGVWGESRGGPCERVPSGGSLLAFCPLQKVRAGRGLSGERKDLHFLAVARKRKARAPITSSVLPSASHSPVCGSRKNLRAFACSVFSTAAPKARSLLPPPAARTCLCPQGEGFSRLIFHSSVFGFQYSFKNAPLSPFSERTGRFHAYRYSAFLARKPMPTVSGPAFMPTHGPKRLTKSGEPPPSFFTAETSSLTRVLSALP